MQHKIKNPVMQRFAKGGLIVLLSAAVIAIYASTLPFQNEKDAQLQSVSRDTQIADDDFSQEQEEKLEYILSQIQGAGHVQVMITYEAGPEIVPAQMLQSDLSEQSDNNGDADSKSVTRHESSQPVGSGYGDAGTIVLKELSPVVKGVVVVAQGADDISVRLNLLRAAVTALQIEESRVDVFTMRKDG